MPPCAASSIQFRKPADEPARVAQATGYNLAGALLARNATSCLKTLPRCSNESNSSNDEQAGESTTSSPGWSHGNRRIERVFPYARREHVYARVRERIRKALARRAKAPTALHFASHASNEARRVGSLVVAAEQENGGVRSKAPKAPFSVASTLVALESFTNFTPPISAARLQTMFERLKGHEALAHLRQRQRRTQAQPPAAASALDTLCSPLIRRSSSPRAPLLRPRKSTRSILPSRIAAFSDPQASFME